MNEKRTRKGALVDYTLSVPQSQCRGAMSHVKWRTQREEGRQVDAVKLQ